jgi:hypothetical protein
MAVDRPLVFTVDALLRYPMSSRVIRVDCAKLSPFVAAPGDPGNGIPLSLFDHPLKVDIAYGGSCTAGKREDFDHSHEVPAWGLAHGLKVPPSGQLFLQYGTTAVRDYCIARGYDKVFEAAGARMLAAISAELQLDLQSKAVWWLGAASGSRPTRKSISRCPRSRSSQSPPSAGARWSGHILLNR